MSEIPASKIHTLKCWPEEFRAVRDGTKTHEYRRNDRDFSVDDIIVLQEWNPTTREYTREMQSTKITHITKAQAFGIPLGYCVMSIKLYDHI